jgi:hypothetical protein
MKHIPVILILILIALLALPPASPSPAPGCYMRRGVCVCAGPLGRLYRAPTLACSIWR